MFSLFCHPSRHVTVLCVLLFASQPFVHGADNPRKAREAEAKRLIGLGRSAEKQGRLLEARQQYLASEQVLFIADAEREYAAENFAKTAQLLDSASALHPGNVAIGCNLALTKYQQGQRDEALPLLEQCVGALRDKEPRRRLAELYTALSTGDRLSV